MKAYDPCNLNSCQRELHGGAHDPAARQRCCLPSSAPGLEPPTTSYLQPPDPIASTKIANRSSPSFHSPTPAISAYTLLAFLLFNHPVIRTNFAMISVYCYEANSSRSALLLLAPCFSSSHASTAIDLLQSVRSNS